MDQQPGRQGSENHLIKNEKHLWDNIMHTNILITEFPEAEERKKIFKDYQINDSVVGVSNEGVMVLHCLPAHRGEEITAKVLEEHADEIFDEAENRLHAQKAVLVKCMAD